MKRILRITTTGLLALFTVSLFIAPDAIPGKKKKGRSKHHKAKKRRHKRGKHRHAYHRHYHYPRWHRYWHHWPRYHHFFGLSVYDRWHHPGYFYYPQTYPYRAHESVLVYKEDPAHYGLLRLDIHPPSTEIFLDGRFVGTAEYLRERATSVPTGEHHLQLKLGPYSTYYRVQVEAGATTTVSRELYLDSQPN